MNNMIFNTKIEISFFNNNLILIFIINIVLGSPFYYWFFLFVFCSRWQLLRPTLRWEDFLKMVNLLMVRLLEIQVFLPKNFWDQEEEIATILRHFELLLLMRSSLLKIHEIKSRNFILKVLKSNLNSVS